MNDTELLMPPRVDPGARTERRRRRSFKRRAIGVGAVAVPILVILVVLLSQLGGEGKPAPAPRPVGNAAEGEQVTYLLVGTRSGDASDQADWLSLLAIDRNGLKPLTVFIPTATLTEVPGFGYEPAGKALALGRVPLTEITVENMLGVQIDHTVLMPDTVLSKLVDRAGGVDVTVKTALLEPRGTNRFVPVFQPGHQHFDGKKALRFLQYVGPDEDELSRFARAQLVWEALYQRFEGSLARGLADRVAGLGDDLITDAPPADVGAFFAAFAGAGTDARSYRSLPVETVSSGGGEDAFRMNGVLYLADLARLLAQSKPAAAAKEPVRVQILNGNGQPEIGLQVATLLVPQGFRVADTGNATRFDFSHTRILVYRSEFLDAARKIRSLLRVGSIEIARTQQSIVDVTIVVGADFAARIQ
jgi:LytR cell envelope-related transcriptional attenuator/cell envelope-related transcriptional attenuator-like protein